MVKSKRIRHELLPLGLHVIVTEGRGAGESGVIVRSGHGFYSIALNTGEEVMKRIMELDVDQSAAAPDLDAESVQSASVSVKKAKVAAGQHVARPPVSGSTPPRDSPPPTLHFQDLDDDELVADDACLEAAASILCNLMQHSAPAAQEFTGVLPFRPYHLA